MPFECSGQAAEGRSRFTQQRQRSQAGARAGERRRRELSADPSPAPSRRGSGSPLPSTVGLSGPGMAQEAAPVLLVFLTRLVSATWHEGEHRGGTGMWGNECQGREGRR